MGSDRRRGPGDRLPAAVWLIAVWLAVAALGAAPGEARGNGAGEARLTDEELGAAVDSVLADPELPLDQRIFALEQLLEDRGDSTARWVYRAANALGRLYLTVGADDKAIHYLELAVSGIEDDADLLNTLGYLYAEHEAHLERAAALVRRALELAPADTPERVRGYYRDSLGWALFRQGKPDSALHELEDANRMAPGTPEIRSHLVEVYDELGERDQASALLVEDLVAARGVDPELRGRLRRLYRTTPQGRPLAVELEVEHLVIAREAKEVAAFEAAGGSVIRVEASDGFPLVATLFAAGGKAKSEVPAALLVPMLGGARSDYDSLALALARAGITALCLDPRGHGASVTEELPNARAFRDDMPRHLHGAILDLAAGIAYLQKASISRGQPLAVIGASLGGFVAALETADEEAVKALVLLSPGTAEPFVEAVGRRHERPTLLVAGSDDPGARAGAEAMLALLDRSRSAVAVFDDAGHGTEMLERVPELAPFLVRWIKGALKGARGL